MKRWGVVLGLAAVLVVAVPAVAKLQATLDPTGLTLTDVSGSSDNVTFSANKVGLFIAVADKANSLDPACPLVSPKFHGFQCKPLPAQITIAAGGGNDRIDASKLSTPLRVDLGAGSDVLIAGAGNDTIASTADGVRDVVVCGAGQDTVAGVADPNDDIGADCESAQRSFAAKRLPKTATVAAPSTMTLSIGRANVPLSFAATLSTAPPKGSHTKGRVLAHASLPATTGPVKLRFKLPKVSKGFLSKRPSIRVQADVTAIDAAGHRYPLSLHSQAPGKQPQLTTLFDNQVRLVIPAKLRHPK
jgi:hypothetical protein